MIRVNLLNNRREPVDGLEAVIAVMGASAFINRREIVLGGLFLALGAGILYLNSAMAGGSDGEVPLAAQASADAAPTMAEGQSARIGQSGGEPAAPDEMLGDSFRQESAGVVSVTAKLGPPEPTVETLFQASARPAAGATPSKSREMPADRRGERRESSSGARTSSSPGPTTPSVRTISRTASRPPQTADGAGGGAAERAIVPGHLSSIELFERGDTLRILATIGTQPAYQMFQLQSPNRVVVDLSGVTLALPASQRQITPSHPLVERVRIAQFQVSPPKARVVFDVSEFPEIAVKPAPEGLWFQVTASAP